MRKIFVSAIFSCVLLNAFSQAIENNIKQSIYFLASDSLKGRKPGTDGDSLSAFYIRAKLKEYGTIPICEHGFQRFSVVTDIVPGKNNELKINNKLQIINKDFIPSTFSSNNTVDGELVFAGYGLNFEQDSTKWNDYSNVEVKDKIVFIFEGMPENASENARKFSKSRTKVLTAKDKGAKAVIFIHKSSDIQKPFDISFDKTISDAGIPVLYITWQKAQEIFKENKLDIEKQVNLSNISKNFKTNVHIVTDVKKIMSPTHNIVAEIEGSDASLKNEYIVIGAHYDHLGMGGKDSGSRMPDTIAVHNGADDNASGVAGILELARMFSNAPVKPKRSLLFVAFTGEEMGLLGSKQFVSTPPVSLKNIVTMFNFDMIGRAKLEKPKLSIGGTGTATEFDSIIKLYEINLPFEVSKSPEGYGPSDHASFYKNNIPVLFFNSGLHEDYHTPFDDADKINFVQEVNILDFSYNIINNIANSNKKLTFKESESKEEKSSGGYKVTLGIIPDVVGSGDKGLAVEGVKKDGPAEKAGIKKGDTITAINGLQVTNIYDYMSRLNTLKAGQAVDVEVLREGKKEIIKVKL